MHLPIIPSFSNEAAEQARQHQSQLTKPAGSLGRLEELSILLAGLKDTPSPKLEQKAVLVFAADHGVVVEGVSAYPSEVTAQMVINFLNGGAAVNVLAQQAGARFCIVDVGVKSDLNAHPDLISERIAKGTANFAQGPAMGCEQAVQALQVGRDALKREAESGLDIASIGEMGIGNTTAASTVIAAVTVENPAVITGRGTGVDDAGLQRKIEVIRRAIKLNQPDPRDALDILSKVGGFEIGAMTGVVIEAASRRIPVVMDGLIASSAAMLAGLLLPDVKPYILPSHRSVEVGHASIFDYLGKEPLFDLQLRLGEGSGAVLAFHFLEAACRTLNEMATFGGAGVSDKEG